MRYQKFTLISLVLSALLYVFSGDRSFAQTVDLGAEGGQQFKQKLVENVEFIIECTFDGDGYKNYIGLLKNGVIIEVPVYKVISAESFQHDIFAISNSDGQQFNGVKFDQDKDLFRFVDIAVTETSFEFLVENQNGEEIRYYVDRTNGKMSAVTAFSNKREFRSSCGKMDDAEGKALLSETYGYYLDSVRNQYLANEQEFKRLKEKKKF